MIKKPLVFIALVVFVVSMAGNACAQAKEKSSFFPNPFAKKSSDRHAKDDKASAVREEGKPRSRFVLPQLPKPSMPQLRLPKWKMPQPGPKKGPSAWDKIRNGTKQFFYRSKQILMPWGADDGGKGKPHSRRISQSGTGKPAGGGGVFSSLLPSDPEEDGVETVNDFLSLPTAHYE